MPTKKKTTKRARNKAADKRRSPATCSRFWVLDTDGKCESQGDLPAKGPFASRKGAEDWIRRDTRELWKDSCTCLKRDTKQPWCSTLIIVEEVCRVLPEIDYTVRVTLSDPENKEI